MPSTPNVMIKTESSGFLKLSIRSIPIIDNKDLQSSLAPEK